MIFPVTPLIIFFFPVPGLRPLLAGVRTLSAFHWSTSEEEEERERGGGEERGGRGRERERERERGGEGGKERIGGRW